MENKNILFSRYTLALLIGLFAVSYAFADYYKYKDKDGVLRFTDDLGEVPVEQRPKMQRYRETKPAPRDSNEIRRSERKEAPKQEAGGPKNRTQTDAQWLILEQKNLEKIYRELMNEKMTLANQAQRLRTPADTKEYRRGLKKLNQRIAKFEERRYKYLSRASHLKDQIEKEKQRQNRPKEFVGTPRTCRECGQQSDSQ